MTSIRRSETYDFWGELMVLMHDDPYLWRINGGRADWVESLDFGGGLRILDLGCGNGFLDIVLARRGHAVTGVDMVGAVIEGARGRVENEPVFTDHPEGRVHWKWSSDEATRLNTLVPELHRTDGVVIELRHPIDPARGDHIGLIRYLYPPDELSHLLEAAGFTVTRIGHFLEFVFPDANPDRYMLLGINQPGATSGH